MRSIILIVLMMCSIAAFTQVPSKINYQAVVRKNDGSILVSSPVGYKFEILEGSINGVLAYTETHTPTTNTLGMIGLKIGEGTVLFGNFSSLDWQHKQYFVRISVDLLGGNNYQFLDASQFLSLPFAFKSNTADSVVNGAPADYRKLTNVPANLDEDASDDLMLTGNQTITGNKNFTSPIVVPSPVNAGDVATKNYIQSLENAVTALEAAIDTLGMGEYVVDFDGNVYKPVTIANQVWLDKDLMTTHFMNGDSILNIPDLVTYSDTSIRNHRSKTFNFFAYKDFNANNKNLFANSYSKNIALDTRNICPLGYHVPTEAEFVELANYVKSTDGTNVFKTSQMIAPNATVMSATFFELLVGMYMANAIPLPATQFRYQLATPNNNGINGCKAIQLNSTSFGVRSETFNNAEGVYPIRCIKTIN